MIDCESLVNGKGHTTNRLLSSCRNHESRHYQAPQTGFKRCQALRGSVSDFWTADKKTYCPCPEIRLQVHPASIQTKIKQYLSVNPALRNVILYFLFIFLSNGVPADLREIHSRYTRETQWLYERFTVGQGKNEMGLTVSRKYDTIATKGGVSV